MDAASTGQGTDSLQPVARLRAAWLPGIAARWRHRVSASVPGRQAARRWLPRSGILRPENPRRIPPRCSTSLKKARFPNGNRASDQCLAVTYSHMGRPHTTIGAE